MNLSTLYKKLTNGKYIIGLGLTIFSCLSFCSADLIGSFTCSNSSTTCGKIIAPADCTDTFSVYLTGGGHKFSVYYNNGNSAKPTFSSGVITSTCNYIEIAGSPGRAGETFPYVVSYGTDPDGGGCPTCPECPICPEINTGEILSGYILESEIDTNYCVGNGYCPNECGSGDELTGINRSTLYINNIQYPGAPTIKFTIPEEIQREDNTDEEEVNIDVIGYGYDQDKMQQMVNTQYYKPTAEEMSGLVEKVADFLPLVAVALLIIRIRRIIKKIFKF